MGNAPRRPTTAHQRIGPAADGSGEGALRERSGVASSEAGAGHVDLEIGGSGSGRGLGWLRTEVGVGAIGSRNPVGRTDGRGIRGMAAQWCARTAMTAAEGGARG